MCTHERSLGRRRKRPQARSRDRATRAIAVGRDQADDGDGITHGSSSSSSSTTSSPSSPWSSSLSSSRDPVGPTRMTLIRIPQRRVLHRCRPRPELRGGARRFRRCQVPGDTLTRIRHRRLTLPQLATSPHVCACVRLHVSMERGLVRVR